MAKQDAAALRAAREARIAARTSATGDQSEEKNITPDEQGEKAEAKSKEATTASAPSAALTAAVLDPSSVQLTASIDLIGYHEVEDPFWVVLASGRPVAEIRLSDQEEPNKIAKVFVTEQYAEGVREAAAQWPFEEVLNGVRARTYLATVSGHDAYKSIEAQVQAEADRKVREAKANLRDDMYNMLNLVVLAQAKNFLQDNPLKDELYTRMTQSGLDERRAVALIEAAYQARAPEHFETCFKQAAKWMDLTPQALTELEEQIKGLGYRQPTVAESDEITRAASAHSPSVHNIPLETRTASAPSDPDEKQQMRETFGFRRRNKNHQMSNR